VKYVSYSGEKLPYNLVIYKLIEKFTQDSCHGS
jgi:hypothetical protein